MSHLFMFTLLIITPSQCGMVKKGRMSWGFGQWFWGNEDFRFFDGMSFK